MIRTYEASWLPKDLSAGITLGILMIPVGLAFGELAGVPMAGLYAGMLPLIAYAMFGSSRQLIVGPDASMAALVAVSVAPLAAGDPGKLAVLAGALAILIGLICILGSLLRLGFMADFLAKQVIVGFMHGLAAIVAIGQLPKLLGVPGGGDTAVAQLVTVIQNLPGVHFLTLAIGVTGVAVILSCRRWFPRVPGQIVVVIGAILAVKLFSLDQAGLAVVGEIPRGLPRVRLPVVTAQELAALIPLALAAALVAFSDSVATSRGFASRNHYRIDANQELRALGLANLAAGVTQGLPISGSGSRTAAAESAGGRTQLTSVIAAAVVACVMMFFTGSLFSLPHAALSAILLAAAWNLCDFGEFARLWRFRGVGLAVAVLTAAGVIGIGVMEGIGIGVLCSMILLLKALAFPGDAVLTRVASGEFRDRGRYPEGKAIPGVMVYRFAAPLFFANCGLFRDRIDALIESSPEPLHAFILDASAFFDVDLAACETLDELHQTLGHRGIRFVIANLRGSARDRLILGWNAAGAEKSLFYPTLDAAIRDVQTPAQVH
jgi:high affinity sulfate transporter 1